MSDKKIKNKPSEENAEVLAANTPSEKSAETLGKDSASAESPQEQAVPVRSKDELQKTLEDMKAQFEHTPMAITPELEKLLSSEIREEKKEKKRAAQMLGVLAKHNFYANGLTPEELRTTLEDLGPTYVKIGQIMSSRVDLLPEKYCVELEKLRQNVKPLGSRQRPGKRLMRSSGNSGMSRSDQRRSDRFITVYCLTAQRS